MKTAFLLKLISDFFILFIYHLFVSFGVKTYPNDKNHNFCLWVLCSQCESTLKCCPVFSIPHTLCYLLLSLVASAFKTLDSVQQRPL